MHVTTEMILEARSVDLNNNSFAVRPEEVDTVIKELNSFGYEVVIELPQANPKGVYITISRPTGELNEDCYGYESAVYAYL